MALEIEYKYLVNGDSYLSMSERCVNMAQGYLSRSAEHTVRIRTAGEKGYITVKGITHGATREEFEYEIPREEAESMLRMCEGRVVRKTRFYVPYEGHTWEIDRFEGDLSPLITAEIELPSEDTPYDIPPFIGRNVTGDNRYYNSSLAGEGEIPPIE